LFPKKVSDKIARRMESSLKDVLPPFGTISERKEKFAFYGTHTQKPFRPTMERKLGMKL